MWFPPHNRPTNRICSFSLSLLLAIAGISVSGCAWQTPLTRFAPEANVATRHQPGNQQLDSARQFDRDPQIAADDSWRGAITAPDPFRWQKFGRSAGGRSLQLARIGQGGYRVLVIGSMAGNDPQGIRFTEELARYLHQNSIIVGGLQVTIVRTANPDGEANNTRTNENGVLVSRQFPQPGNAAASGSSRSPEVKAILQLVREQRPQRVIHLRTYGDDRGLIAASAGAETAATEVADWAGLAFVSLPGRSREGTLERYLASEGDRQIITLAVPEGRQKSADDVWTAYRDAVLNLLLDEDYQTRKLARERGQSQSARRDSTWDSGESAFDSDEGLNTDEGQNSFGEFTEE